MDFKEFKTIKINDECLKHLQDRIKQVEDRIKNEIVVETDIERIKELQAIFKGIQRVKAAIFKDKIRKVNKQ